MTLLKLLSPSFPEDCSDLGSPELIIRFIRKVMDDFRPIYSRGGHWNTNDMKTISDQYESRDGLVEFSYYDGKIFHGKYKNVLISLIHWDMTYTFIFKNFEVILAEDYSYMSDNIMLNSLSISNRYNSALPGFEDLLNIEGTIGNPLSVLVCLRSRPENGS